MLEAVVLSLTPSYIASLKDKSPKLYASANKLKQDLEKPLASILTFNTIAHTVGAAGAGAEAQRMFGSNVLAIFSAILTFIILFFSEIIPKSIGASNWKRLLPATIFLLKPMVFVSYPIVVMSQFVSALFKKKDNTFSRDEISAMAEVGLTEGILETQEYQKIKSILKFRSIKIESIMTPKDSVNSVDFSQTIKEAYEVAQTNTHSRLVVFGVDQNDVKGFLLRVKLQKAFISDPESQVKDHLNRMLIVSHEKSLSVLMGKLMERKEHLAAVVNNSGEFIGVISLEDIIEHMLDLEIFDEQDTI